MAKLSDTMIGKIREWAGRRENNESAEAQTNKALKFQILLLTDLLETMTEIKSNFQAKEPLKKA